MDFSILYALQHLHNAVLDRVMVGITSLGNAGWIWIALTACRQEYNMRLGASL